MDNWKALNTTNKELVYNNCSDLFTFYEIICFLINVKYWKSSDIIIITNGSHYITWVDYKYSQKYNVDDFTILNIFCKDYLQRMTCNIFMDSYNKITFTLKLLISIEEYCKINKSLKEEFPLFDFKRIVA